MLEKNIATVGQIYKNKFTPDKPAILFKDERVTYKQLDDQVIAYANLLKAKGISEGDKVILNTINSPEFVYIYFGTVRNAATIVPINPMLTLEEMKYISGDSQAKFLVIHEGIMMKQGLTPEALSESLELKVILINEALIREADTAARSDYDLVTNGREVSTFLYTSGTTGRPKAAMLTHDNLVSNAWQCVINLEAREDDVLMCVLPMFHVFAFTTCILLPLIDGETINIVESFTPKTVISELLEKQVSLFLGVPAMYMVLAEAGKKNIKFPKLRTAVCGGSALPVEIYNQVRETVGIPIVEGYGLTEASPACFFNPPSGIQKPGSIGKVMIEIEYRIGDENDEALPPGEVGELLLKGPNIMLGYFGREDETAETLRNGWLHTGDLAKYDDEGYVYIVDRKKDLIIVSGLNVYPREVEEALYMHPKVKDAAVIGVPDGLRGEKVAAYIVTHEGEEGDNKEIIRWLKERLAAYKIPRSIEFRDDLPRNSTGKIMKRMLR